MRFKFRLTLVLGILIMIHAAPTRAQAAVPDEIPDAILQASAAVAEPAPSSGSRRFLEAALTLPSYRDDLLVPLPPPSRRPHWRARVDVDVQESFRLSPSTSLTLGNRFNVQHAEEDPWETSRVLRNDLRELYLTWSSPEHMLDLGRINIRGGVASGFNPTDYFRARSVVERVSQDPSVLRENRLGTVALRSQSVFPSGAIAMVLAPKLQNAPPVDLVGESGLRPQTGRTNASNRLLIRGNYKLAPDFDPEVSLFVEHGRAQLGLSLTRAITERITASLEWSGGRRQALAARAYRAGVAEQRFPENFRPAIPYSTDERFRHDLSLGLTMPASANVDATIEYNYHQGGFSSHDWERWFSAGRNTTNPAILGQLNYLRAYAVDQQEPMSRHNLFTRIEWRNSLARNVTLTQLNILNLKDRSSLEQLTIKWDVSRVLSVSAILMIGLGGQQTEHGSNSVGKSVLFNLVRYF